MPRPVARRAVRRGAIPEETRPRVIPQAPFIGGADYRKETVMELLNLLLALLTLSATITVLIASNRTSSS